MAAWTTNGDAPALGADGDVCDVARTSIDGDGCCLWKDSVGVGQQQQDQALLALAAPGVDVAGGVDFRAISSFSPERGHQLCACLLVPCWCGNRADALSEVGDCFDVVGGGSAQLV